MLVIVSAIDPIVGRAQTMPGPTPCSPFPVGKNGLLEIQGIAAHQSLWALLFPYHLPLWAGEDVKIVWRMTGVGDFSISAHAEDGSIIRPIWGPEEHGGSNWSHPGAEWGTGFHFSTPGCWRMLIQRGDDSGEVDLLVVKPYYGFF